MRKDKEIIFALHGGLGNQIFQYAAGLYAEKRWGIPVRFQTLAPKEDPGPHPRPFLLDRFCITRPVKRVSPIFRRSMYGSKWMSLKKVIHRVSGVRILRETTPYENDPLLENPPVNERTFLFGFWQTAAYSEEIDPLLRQEFRFKYPAEGRNAQILEQICSESYPVSLHIRRGDYELAPRGSLVLPLDYYHRTVENF